MSGLLQFIGTEARRVADEEPATGERHFFRRLPKLMSLKDMHPPAARHNSGGVCIYEAVWSGAHERATPTEPRWLQARETLLRQALVYDRQAMNLRDPAGAEGGLVLTVHDGVARVEFKGDSFPRARAQLSKLEQLRGNWDDCGASAITPRTVSCVRRHLGSFAASASMLDATLADPWLAASQDGSIGIEWQHEGRRLAVTFVSTGEIEFYAHDPSAEFAAEVSEEQSYRLARWLLKGGDHLTGL